MNQRGEMNLVFVLIVVTLSGVMILCALMLQRSFSLLKTRTELFVCAKETEGELTEYVRFMGRTNWGLKNIRKAQIIMVFIPGLQGAAADGEKLRKILKTVQDLGLVAYLNKLSQLRTRGCPIDPRLLITPFHLNGRGYQRDSQGAAKIRKNKWTNHYVSYPYSLNVEWNTHGYESPWPVLARISSEKTAKLSSILSSY